MPLFLQIQCAFDKSEKHGMSVFSILIVYYKLDYGNPFAESLIDRIMVNCKKIAQYAPLKGIRSDYFYWIKKEFFNDVTTNNNGDYLNSRSNKKVYFVELFNDGKIPKC